MPHKGLGQREHASLASYLAAIDASRNARELEVRFRATFDHFRYRTRERIRKAVLRRGGQLCELRDKRGFVPRYTRRSTRLTVCGESIIVGRGHNSAGVCWVWAHADEWTRATLAKHGASPSLIREIVDWWKHYPHRALRALERRRLA